MEWILVFGVVVAIAFLVWLERKLGANDEFDYGMCDGFTARRNKRTGEVTRPVSKGGNVRWQNFPSFVWQNFVKD